jgi:aspartyl-tRNA(Asn)/glutamyl-tRNA(Gln) amidotransferase subunit A
MVMMRFLLERALDEWREAQQNGHADLRANARTSWSALDRLFTYSALVAKRRQAVDEMTGGADVPVVVKDCFVDEGRAPTMGSRLPAGWMRGTAEVIRRLRVAGAVILGYANLHEWMIGTTSRVSAFGPVVNPSDPLLIAGGSSGGSAVAVASGVVPFAVGTDAGGSIRIPAACCGVVGMKPTWGLVPTDGFADDGSPIDHVGPLARSVTDAYSLLQVLAARSIPSPDAGSLRIGIARREFFADAQEEVSKVVVDAVERLRPHVASVEEIAMPGVTEGARAAVASFILRDVARLLQRDRSDWRDLLQPESVPVLSRGASLSEDDRAQAESIRERVSDAWSTAFQRVDVIVSPTLPSPVARVGARSVRLSSGDAPLERAYVAWNAPMNLGGVPCLSLPCGVLPGGQTVNLSLTAARGRDGDALAVGKVVETL